MTVLEQEKMDAEKALKSFKRKVEAMKQSKEQTEKMEVISFAFFSIVGFVTASCRREVIIGHKNRLCRQVYHTYYSHFIMACGLVAG